MAKPCQHCRKRPVGARWTLRPCALGRKIAIRLCKRCDVALNGYVLRFMRHPRAKSLMTKYAGRT